VKNKPGELWELIPHYSALWKSEEQTYILIKQIKNTNVWISLCIETSSMFTITVTSSIYQRVA